MSLLPGPPLIIHKILKDMVINLAMHFQITCTINILFIKVYGKFNDVVYVGIRNLIKFIEFVSINYSRPYRSAYNQYVHNISEN